MDEQEIINEALSILKERMHKPDFYATTPIVVKDYLRLKLGELEHKTFNVLFLDSKHVLISLTEMFRVTIDSAAVPVREVVKDTLSANASAVIFSHNHPSGVCDPSTADKRLTNDLNKALNLVGVRVLDHIIIGGGDQVHSMAEYGELTFDCK